MTKSPAQRFHEATGGNHRLVERGCYYYCSCGKKWYAHPTPIAWKRHTQNPTYSNAADILNRMKEYLGEEEYREFIDANQIGIVYHMGADNGYVWKVAINEEYITNPYSLLEKAWEYIKQRKRRSVKMKYDKYMDKECIELCNILNKLPGITTTESCCGHGKDSFQIFLKVNKKINAGLFILARSLSNRYWKYGHLWKLEVIVGDVFRNQRLPINYYLHSGNIKGKQAYKQSQSLVNNIEYHLHHKEFLKYYKLGVLK